MSGFGFHVALIDSVEKFVTQFDLLNWIVDKKDKFKDIWKKRLSELGLIDSQVVSISEREPVARVSQQFLFSLLPPSFNPNCFGL
jgi:hypothetical protein